MMRIKQLKYIVILLALTTCIKPFEPEFKAESVQKIVVDGMISSIEGWQNVTVSVSAPSGEPRFTAVNNCQVEIMDDIGQKFELSPYEDGKYQVWMSAEYLVPGRAYKVKITTPDGETIESDFDRMPQSPEMDDVFFEIETLPTNDPEEWIYGIQFYTNIYGNEEDSRYYRWQMTETWEYHSAFPIEFYYDGEIQQEIPPDSSQMFCWENNIIGDIYTLSTDNLDENAYERIPLNYVDNTTDRLTIMYSMLIHQIALSESAWRYWDELRINSSDQGGMYSSQPLAVKGNMKNINHPNLDVLGFFQASSIMSKRIFVEPVEGLELEYSNTCNPVLLRKGLQELLPNTWPAYLMTIEGNWSTVFLNDECVLCTQRGGSTTKPDYWPI